MTDQPRPRRFLTISQAAEELNANQNQIRALLRTGELRGLQVGEGGLWGIGANDVENYMADVYRRTTERIAGELKDEGDEASE